jgi:hypothetical protein
MKIIQNKDGSCDIVFSWKEKFILLKKGKLHLPPETLRHFGNTLMKIVIQWNQNFDKGTSLKQTFSDTELKTK